MKKLTIILVILIYSLNSFSQGLQTKEGLEALKALKYKQYCFDKSKKEIRQGMILQIVGLGIFTATRFDEINGKKSADEYWRKESQVIWRVEEMGGRTDLLYDSIHGKYNDRLRRAEKLKRGGLISGCVFAAVGLGLQVHSIKWLRNAQIGQDGIGFKIPLNK